MNWSRRLATTAASASALMLVLACNDDQAGIEEADAIILIGSNPRLEASVLNARLRKRWLKGNVFIGVIGEQADLNYSYAYLGAGPESLARLANDERVKGEKIAFIIGQGALARPDGAAVLADAVKAAKALGGYGEASQGAVALLTLQQLKDGHPDARSAAAEALRRIGKR